VLLLLLLLLLLGRVLDRWVKQQSEWKRLLQQQRTLVQDLLRPLRQGAINTCAAFHSSNMYNSSSSSSSVYSTAANSSALPLLVPAAPQAGTLMKQVAAAMAAVHRLQQHLLHAPGCTTARLQSSRRQAAVAQQTIGTAAGQCGTHLRPLWMPMAAAKPCMGLELVQGR
jgi:hypothetical protein